MGDGRAMDDSQDPAGDCKRLRAIRKRPVLVGNSDVDVGRRTVVATLNCLRRDGCVDRALCTITCTALLGELP